MCAVMEDRIKEDRFDLARKSIARGKDLEEISLTFELPLSEVQKLAEEMKKQPKAE